MSQLDPFAAELVALVRALPDETILDLVRCQLGLATDGSAAPAPARPTSRKERKRAGKKRGRPAGSDRAARTAAVEEFVRASSGVGLAEVASATGLSKGKAQYVLKTLKEAGRIACAGDRRFARYAADRKTAFVASERARSLVWHR